MLLSICIPTYNRCAYLKKNIVGLLDSINQLQVSNLVDIHVIDNCSTDDTEVVVRSFANNSSLIKYFRNSENIGIGRNICKSFSISDSQFFMTLGDDDYISQDYLQEVLEILKNNNPSMILGNFIGIDSEGNCISEARELVSETISTSDYNLKTFWAIELAHQLSGLVFRRVVFTKSLKDALDTTIYPQVYLALHMASNGEFVHILHNPVKVTQTNKKDWKYDISGYLFELLSGYYYLSIKRKDKALLEIKALNRDLVTRGRLIKGLCHPIMLLHSLLAEKRLEQRFKVYFLFFLLRKELLFAPRIIIQKIKGRR